MLSEQEHQFYSIHFDLLAFIYDFPELGEKFHNFTQEFIDFLKIAFKTCQHRLLKQFPGSTVKTKLDIKLTNVPPIPDIICESIRNLG